MKSNNSYLLKVFEIFFILLVIIGLSQYFDIATGIQMEVITNTGMLWIVFGTLLGLSIVLAFAWHMVDKKTDLHKWIQTIIAFYAAHQIATYGAAKIMKTQFQIPEFIRESQVGDLNGFWLTWTYFGFSPTFAFILGALQIFGAILLVFRKTRLLATCILLPIMVNIDFIDHFYEISPLAYYNALHYTFILIFLMFQDFDKLISAFFSYKEYFYFNRNTVLLNLVRVIVIGGAFLHIFFLKQGIQAKTAINGVWKIEEITIQNQRIVPSLATVDSVWSKVYFEWRYGCVFKYNPYQFNDKKDLRGQYVVDEHQRQTRISFTENNKADSLKLNYEIKGRTMTMWGKYKKSPLIMKLSRLK